jgi:RNA polymerase sigma factor (sigma-70 family)
MKQTREWTDAEKLTLSRKALARDRRVVPDICDAYLPEALKIAKFFSRGRFSKRDDIMGAAMHGLVVAATSACTGSLYDTNLDKYVRVTIRSYVRNFLQRDFIIPIPRKEFKRRMLLVPDFSDWLLVTTNNKGLANSVFREGVVEVIPIIQFLGRELDNEDGDGDESLIDNIPAPAEVTREQIRDVLFQLGLSTRDARIIYMRLEGYTQGEIATKFSVTEPRICQILEEIRSRWIERGLIPPKFKKLTATQTCRCCGQDKSLSDFYQISTTPPRFKQQCKDCLRIKRT